MTLLGYIVAVLACLPLHLAVLLPRSAQHSQLLAASWPSKPHVVLWLTDDQGWANIGRHNEHVRTPTMDRMASEGVFLERHYTYPWCSPSRAALMTGRMPHDGLQQNRQFIPESVPMIAQVMKEAGYSTHHVGKWHLGGAREWQYPSRRGFDTSLGFTGGKIDYVSQYADGPDFPCAGIDLQENANPARGLNGTFSSKWHESAINKSIANRDTSKPFFLFVALQFMHSPNPGKEGLGSSYTLYKDLGYEDIFAESNAMITVTDRLLGQLNQSLSDAGMWQNTVIITMSDNGGAVELGSSTEVQSSNWPLKGGKRTFFEGGVRTPSFLYGGAVPALMLGKKLYGYVHIADWFNTLAELAGSSSFAEGGFSMVQYFSGKTSHSPRNTIILGAGETGNTVAHIEAVIHGPWKLIHGSMPCVFDTYQGPVYPNLSTPSMADDGNCNAWPCRQSTQTYLYNIQHDPNEVYNMASTIPEKVNELFTHLADARKSGKPFPSIGQNVIVGGSLTKDTKRRLCESYMKRNDGFLGPWLEGVDVAMEHENQMADETDEECA